MAKPRLIIGLMSGTSVDAVDAALVRISVAAGGRYRAKVLHHTEHRWPAEVRERLLGVMAPAACRTEALCALNFVIARHFAAAVEKLLGESGMAREKIIALASHGQTVCHLPPPIRGARARRSDDRSTGDPPRRGEGLGSTLQLGDPCVLATLTGITTVANFRTADMAVGGHGAPLVPFADDLLLSHPTKCRAIQNIGGIANVTYLPPLGESGGRGAGGRVKGRAPVIAFDTGPGNMLMDAVISLATQGGKRYDRNGALAATGALDKKLLKQLQSDAYFAAAPPKSTGRELFGLALAGKIHERIRAGKLSVENALHTLTRLTAWSIGDAYRRHLPAMPEEVVVCGGGADNRTLMAMLREELGEGRPLVRIDRFGIPNKSKEAASFAVLGAATLDGRPANLPSVTGARRATILGSISPQ